MAIVSTKTGKMPRLIEGEHPWKACSNCGQVLYRREWDQNLQVCPSCNHHSRLSAEQRIAQLCDEGSFEEWDAGLRSADPLGFVDERPYAQRQSEAEEKTGAIESLITGQGTIEQIPVILAVFEYFYMGGSMGAVLGEKFCRAVERAVEKRLPVLQVSASGGARMQEGTISLMQMARVSAAVAELRRKGLPFISLLTDPTTGGVAASSAMQGDVILAEPGALVGFAGPRVVEQTTGTALPPGFQRSEFLLKHGFVDQIVPRSQLCGRIARILRLLGAGETFAVATGRP